MKSAKEIIGMEWDNEKCLQLIKLYEIKPEIWKTTHKFYYNKIKKHDAWNGIASDMGTTVDVVKGKLNSLLSSFRREKAKQENSMRTGSGRDEIYQSKWFGYEAFQFLIEKSKCRNTLYTTKINLEAETVKDNDVHNELEIPSENEATEVTENLAINNNSPTQETASQIITEKPTGVPPPTKKRKIEAKSDDPRLERAFNILEGCATRDANEIYGEHIAMKLRGYTKRTQAFVQHLFNNILFKADMGQYDNINATNAEVAVYNHLPSSSISTVQSPYPSPHTSIISNSTWSETSTPFTQPPSPYSSLCSPQATHSYNDSFLPNANETSTSVGNTTENSQILPSVSHFVHNFNPNSSY